MANKSQKHKTQTGGLQEKKIKIPPTREEIVAEQKAQKLKRKDRVKANRKERVGMIKRLRDVGGELRKVRWPSFGTTVKQTGVVLGVVVIFSLVIFALDMGLKEMFRFLIPPSQGGEEYGRSRKKICGRPQS